jgi:hypothetical protein
MEEKAGPLFGIRPKEAWSDYEATFIETGVQLLLFL